MTRFSPESLYEAEVVPGLEHFAVDELRSRFGGMVSDIGITRAGFLRFRFSGGSHQLAATRSVIAVYCVYGFDIPRPKAFLGHQHFTRLIRILRAQASLHSRRPGTFGIGAAGADSAVMRRLRSALAEALNLQPASDGKGELFLRLLRQRDGAGWEVALRTTPQPLSKRAYRRIDAPGALNATAAYAMTAASVASGAGATLNLCSGTSTLLIEHALTQATAPLIAVDNSRAMVEAGATNARAAGLGGAIQHLLADARRIPLPDQSAGRIYADLPFGHHIGSHQENVGLYPAILQEAARLARPNARFVILTHEVKLLRRCLEQSSWQALSETRINLRGLHPRLFVLSRNSNTI